MDTITIETPAVEAVTPRVRTPRAFIGEIEPAEGGRIEAVVRIHEVNFRVSPDRDEDGNEFYVIWRAGEVGHDDQVERVDAYDFAEVLGAPSVDNARVAAHVNAVIDAANNAVYMLLQSAVMAAADGIADQINA